MNPSALSFSRRSIAEVLYPKGTIVVCRNPKCGKPLYRLQQSIFANEPFGKSAVKYAPVSMNDVLDLLERSDLEPGQRAFLKTFSLGELRDHCERIQSPKAGDFADCPACKEPFLFGRIAADADGGMKFGDKAFVVKLAIIPPKGSARRAS